MPFGVTPEIPPTNNAAMLLAQNGLSSGAFGPFGSAGEKPETRLLYSLNSYFKKFMKI